LGFFILFQKGKTGEPMDLFELKKEQYKLAQKIQLHDLFNKPKTIAGAACIQVKDKILACIVVCEFPSMKILENSTYLLHNPLPYRQDFSAYREMPALIEAYNKLNQEPDLLLVEGEGILHPRKIGLASHLGLALNKSTIGIQDKLTLGYLEHGKITLNQEIVGFEIKSREHSNPIYISPGHLITLGSTLNIIPQTIHYPHKLPEPIHLAHKIARKKSKEME